jgi:2-polyprenyl-3-methyl-5-hydroxy-6-metoxy-1,4-benzoquinol methylase
MFEILEKINSRPKKPFEYYTASELWTDEHTSKQMLAYHLNQEIDLSSRNAAFIEKSIEWISQHFNIEAGIKIADFGCGPGLYTTKLAKKQAQVTGIDFSQRSIQYAQQLANNQNLPIEYVNQNYLTFQTDKRFDLIIMIMCDFCALSPTQRKAMLSKFHSILKPNGSVLLDVYSLKGFEQREEIALYALNQLNGFWSANKYYGFLNTFKYEQEKVVLDKYTLIEAERTRTVYNWLQYFSPQALEREFIECGFTIEQFYSDVAGSPFDSETQEFAIVAKKFKSSKNA